ncbi:hypothetical protein BS78_06G067200 [Paspalum vaginatum]|nr:hypothetical protein BS78_06G067200 [Paspalum vaginatum]KAJ1270627.1 hypothetical protein BS78_06G067200 [Paspalum vaginatum]KAJ1270628.1 hypothetical protein BS78_06G067200 [Paspalum vaginatum]KAJ1270629.1 hypothetical protein BS78_06G067200 [Paspalum vaginatum]
MAWSVTPCPCPVHAPRIALPNPAPPSPLPHTPVPIRHPCPTRASETSARVHGLRSRSLPRSHRPCGLPAPTAAAYRDAVVASPVCPASPRRRRVARLPASTAALRRSHRRRAGSLSPPPLVLASLLKPASSAPTPSCRTCGSSPCAAAVPILSRPRCPVLRRSSLW